MGFLDGLTQNYQNGIQGLQQIFQNAGYNQQQTGQSIAQGLLPRALGGQGYVSPAYGSGTTSGNYPYTAPSSTGGGQVLGPTNTNNTSTNTGGGGGGGGGGDPTRDAFNQQRAGGAYAGWGDAEAWADFLATGGQQGGGGPQLDSGYNDYFRMLDEQMEALGGQRTNQEQIAQNTYDQGFNTATSQYDQSQQNLDTNRQKTLRDLTDNLTQSFKQGNTFLGTRGASDSSAANQYAYALAKEGNRSRGDVQSQYDQNLFQLKNIYDTETKNLELQKNSQLQQIAQWFSEAQNTLRGQKGQAALQKSQEALSYAMQAAQQVQQATQQKISLLDQWAANHATSFQQLQGQLGLGGQFNVQAPNQFGQPSYRSGQVAGLFGYGSQSDEDRRRGIFN